MHPDDETNVELAEKLETIKKEQEDLAVRAKNLEETITKFNEQLRQMRLQAIYLTGKEDVCKDLLEPKTKEEDNQD